MDWFSDNIAWIAPAVLLAIPALIALLRAIAPRTKNKVDDLVLKYAERIDIAKVEAWLDNLRTKKGK